MRDQGHTAEIHNVFVFDAKSDVLKQRLKLPQEGEILLFDNYPDQMFYYQPSAPQSTISVLYFSVL